LKTTNLQQPKFKIYEKSTCGGVDVLASSTDKNNKTLH